MFLVWWLTTIFTLFYTLGDHVFMNGVYRVHVATALGGASPTEPSANELALNHAALRNLVDIGGDNVFGGGDCSGRGHRHDDGEDHDGKGGGGELHCRRKIFFGW